MCIISTPKGLRPQDNHQLCPVGNPALTALQQQLLRTIGHLVAQTDWPLLSHWFFFSSNAHIPPWTASKSTGFKSPYSPDATSMTEPEAKTERHRDDRIIRNVSDRPQQSIANT